MVGTRIVLFLGLACLGPFSTDTAFAACTLPNAITNGQTADASAVMGNFNQLVTCLGSGTLTVPPVASLDVTSPGGGTATIRNPTATVPYDFNLPANAGTSGQVLTSNGIGSTTSWTTAPAAVPAPLPSGIPVGLPSGSSLTWMNQGTATYAEHAGGPITVSIPAQSGDQLRGLGMAPPSPPYTLTAKIDTLLWGSNYYLSGLYALDSSGKLLTLSYQTDSSSGTFHTIGASHWNSVTSFNSQTHKPISESSSWWFRISNDGTNWTLSLSANGADWIQFYSEPVTSFLGSTITSLGVYGDNNDTAGVAENSSIGIWSFMLEAGTGTDSSWAP